MQVTIQYTDSDSLTMEEVVQEAITNYGQFAKVTVAPESSMAYDYLYFALQQLITYKQISLYYDKVNNYNQDIKGIRSEVIQKVTEILDQVILDNENRLTGE